MNVEDAWQLLEHEDQGHVLRFWDRLDFKERKQLLNQIGTLDLAMLRDMRAALKRHQAGGAAAVDDPLPAEVVEMSATERAAAIPHGEESLRGGKVAALLVAGGQGSRLGFDGPKGAYPIGPVSNAVLFHFHARKILGLSRAYGTSIPFYVMTSEANDGATRECFAAHDWFGLAPGDVFFFQQGMCPALDDGGRIILDAPGHIFMSPDGHGGTLSALQDSGGLDDMRRRGIETVFYFQVDNPLVEIADPAFVGLHLMRGADLSLKLCAKRDPNEGLGMVVRGSDGRHAMIEYTELTAAQKERRREGGELYYKYGSVAIHIFQIDFLQREADAQLPLHVAHKKIAVCRDDGSVVTPNAPNGFKFEKFIFDALPHAETLLNVAFDRWEEFSPVKNATGADSPDSCRRDMIAKWGRWLAEAGVALPRDADGHPTVAVEIDPAYARNAAELKQRLAGEGMIDTTDRFYLYVP